ncbi:MAG: hypothetical protein ACRED5_06090 [Propylenella sp.]
MSMMQAWILGGIALLALLNSTVRGHLQREALTRVRARWRR